MVYDIKLRKLSFTFLNVDPIVQILNLVLEKTLESPSQPVHSKRNQSRIFIRRTDAEAEGTILWPSDLNSQFIGKDPDAGKD